MAASRWQIAITGVGLVTPLGLTAAHTVETILRGQSAVPVRPADGMAVATVPDFDLAKSLRNPKNLKLMSRSVRMALMACQEALASSRFPESEIAPERLGVFVGSGQTGLEYDEFFKALTVAWENGREQDFKYLGGMASKLIDRYFSLRSLANAGVAAISTEFNARGPSNNYVQGEIAPAVAIHNACYELMEGRCDAAIVCGYDSLLIPSNLVAFRRLKLLSGDGLEAAYAPFDAARDGMVLGEGAGCLILERRQEADARGATIIGEIDGVGLASQASDETGLTAPVEDLRSAALDAANPVRADFVVARGLGTPDDDLAEGMALRSIIGSHLPVTAFKGHTGYLGAATAAVELGIGLLCARQGVLPAIARLKTPDERLHLAFVRNRAAKLCTESMEPQGLFFSSTFGGQVAAIAAHAVPGQGSTNG